MASILRLVSFVLILVTVYTQRITPPVEFNHLHKHLVPGDIVTSWGVFSYENKKRFTVNLYNGNEDIMLHVNFRPVWDYVVLNSKKGGVWQREVISTFPQFEDGDIFKVTMECEIDQFRIYVDDEELGILPYRTGFSLKDVDYINLQGDVWTGIRLPLDDKDEESGERYPNIRLKRKAGKPHKNKPGKEKDKPEKHGKEKHEPAKRKDKPNKGKDKANKEKSKVDKLNDKPDNVKHKPKDKHIGKDKPKGKFKPDKEENKPWKGNIKPGREKNKPRKGKNHKEDKKYKGKAIEEDIPLEAEDCIIEEKVEIDNVQIGSYNSVEDAYYVIIKDHSYSLGDTVILDSGVVFMGIPEANITWEEWFPLDEEYNQLLGQNNSDYTFIYNAASDNSKYKCVVKQCDTVIRTLYYVIGENGSPEILTESKLDVTSTMPFTQSSRESNAPIEEKPTSDLFTELKLESTSYSTPITLSEGSIAPIEEKPTSDLFTELKLESTSYSTHITLSEGSIDEDIEGTVVIMLCNEVYYKNCDTIRLSPYKYKYVLETSVKSMEIKTAKFPVIITSDVGTSYKVQGPFSDFDLTDGFSQDVDFTIEHDNGVITSVRYGKPFAHHFSDTVYSERNYSRYDWKDFNYNEPTYFNKTTKKKIKKIIIAIDCKSSFGNSLYEGPEIVVEFINDYFGQIETATIELLLANKVGKLQFNSTKHDLKGLLYEETPIRVESMQCDDVDMVYEIEITEGIIYVTSQGEVLALTSTSSTMKYFQQYIQEATRIKAYARSYNEGGYYPTFWIAFQTNEASVTGSSTKQKLTLSITESSPLYTVTEQLIDAVTKVQPDTTTEPETTPAFNISDIESEVKAILTNSIELTTQKVNDTDWDRQDEEDIEPLYTWKPKFNGRIPAAEVKKKSKEYKNNRSKSKFNVLGYLTYNGHTDFGLHKKLNKKLRQESKSDVRKDKFLKVPDTDVDNEVMLDAIKNFQRFNGFPETGELTASMVDSFDTDRCGNKDVDFYQNENAWICKEGNYDSAVVAFGTNSQRKTQSPNQVNCPHFDKKFRNCIIMPSSLQLDAYRHFVYGESYYFEADVHFHSDEKYEHVALAFNYKREAEVADYIYFKYFSKQLCFSYGTFKEGKRTHVLSVKKCLQPNKEQIKLKQFKLRVDVSKDHAYVSVNNRDVFDYKPFCRTRSSALLFTLGGMYYKKNKLEIITSRICKRRIEKEGIKTRDEQSRKKRFALSRYKWSAPLIQYAFVNYSSILGPEVTRTEILRAVDAYESIGISFQEVTPDEANNVADITFMFIKGKHFDGLSFDGAGKEKAHAFAPVHGEIHFNDHEKFSTVKGTGTTNLFYVALHEIGHSLGLAHSGLNNAVMHKDYNEDKAYAFNNFHHDDIDAISAQYRDYLKTNSVHSMLMKMTLSINTKYIPKSPIPRECHNRIEAAFHYYPRGNNDVHAYYLFTNGFLWKYHEVGKVAVFGYPRRVSEVFHGIERKVDAAFDTGKVIYLITGNMVYEYKMSIFGNIVSNGAPTTLADAFGIEESDTTIRSAFNDYKTKKDKKTVKSTLVVSQTLHYRITWSNKAKTRLKTERVVSSTDIIGEEFAATEFRAAFEYERELASGETRFEVLQFDSGRTARSKVPYPGGDHKKRTGQFDIPTIFAIQGWCRIERNES